MELQLQDKAAHKKEELKREEGLEKAAEELIDAIYYYRMWDSEACWIRVTQTQEL